MSSIDNIITINTTIAASSPAQAGFGVPLVFGNSQAISPDYTRTYDIAAALADMVTDGYATTSASAVAMS